MMFKKLGQKQDKGTKKNNEKTGTSFLTAPPEGYPYIQKGTIKLTLNTTSPA
jgi:hypothetical protein